MQIKITNGQPWAVIGVCTILTIIFGIILIQNFSWMVLILTLIPMAYCYFAIEVLEPNEKGAYILLNELTNKFTDEGGVKAKIPFLEKIVRFETGMFTMETEYNNLTLNRGDNVSGKILLTVELDEKYFNILYKITDGDFDREKIKSKTMEKLKESVPAKMAIALQKYTEIAENGINSIDEGREFEVIVKKADFAEILKKVLSRYNEKEEENNRWSDCYGLKLLKVEIPTPTIEGELYETFRKKEASIQARELAKEKAKEFGEFFKQHLKSYKKQTNDSDPSSEKIAKLRDEAMKLYQQQQGADVRYYDGLGGGNNVMI